MDKATLVIVTGLPATGKTTLAHLIGKECVLPTLIKDDLKEIIADSVGAKDPSVKGLGTASNQILFYTAKEFLKNGLSLIIEGNFKDTEYARKFIEFLRTQEMRVFEIQCTAAYEVRVERYKTRRRHPVHPTLTDPVYAQSFKTDKPFILGIGTRIDVDTSDFSKIPYGTIFSTLESRR